MARSARQEMSGAKWSYRRKTNLLVHTNNLRHDCKCFMLCVRRKMRPNRLPRMVTFMTPNLKQLASETAKSIMIDYTNCDTERLAKTCITQRIESALKQAAKAERERLAEALKPYLAHKHVCSVIQYKLSCDCGLNAALKGEQ